MIALIAVAVLASAALALLAAWPVSVSGGVRAWLTTLAL